MADQEDPNEALAATLAAPLAGAVADGGKRKLEDDIQLAKQKAQEIAARLVGNAEPKRPRLDNLSEPASLASGFNSVANPPYPVATAAQLGQNQALQGMSKKISIPNGKVGVIIGKGGETIKHLQLRSGARIQITRDSEADPYSLTRDVELMGTSEQITRAEELINEVISETDAGGSAQSAIHGLNATQPGADQVVLKVPNNKVALLIGKGGETIKAIQSRSGARVQVIPLHLPPGDTSTERNVFINGLNEQIESAKELINEVVSGKRIISTPGSNSYGQPVYSTPAAWAPQGQTPMQQPQYGYSQPGTYPTPPYYGNYPPQVASWDSSSSTAMSQPPQQTTGYAYYGQQAQTGAVAPDPSYNYSQTTQFSGQSYGQNYSQQPVSYVQNSSSASASQTPPPFDQHNPYVSSGYGLNSTSSQTDGAASQSTQLPPAYPTSYSQPMDNSQVGYWNAPNYSGQPPPQAGYDQTAYSQTSYGSQGLPSSTQPVYGQGGYPPQPTPVPANYGQAPNPPSYAQAPNPPSYGQAPNPPYPPSYGQAPNPPSYGQAHMQPQPHLEPPTNGLSQPSTYSIEKAGDGEPGPAPSSVTVTQEAAQS